MPIFTVQSWKPDLFLLVQGLIGLSCLPCATDRGFKDSGLSEWVSITGFYYSSFTPDKRCKGGVSPSSCRAISQGHRIDSSDFLVPPYGCRGRICTVNQAWFMMVLYHQRLLHCSFFAVSTAILDHRTRLSVPKRRGSSISVNRTQASHALRYFSARPEIKIWS